ncbi:MAG TPA: hypothetical protein VGD74_02260 [Vulgatibacter sp.]
MSIAIEPRAPPASPSPVGGRTNPLDLLVLARRELAQVIRDEIERNPLLEEASRTLSQDRFDELRELTSIERYALLEDEHPRGDDGPVEEVMAADGPDEIDWEDYPNHSLLSPAGLADEPASGVAEAPSLYEHLAAQLRLTPLTPDEARVGSAILASVDESGYFRLEGIEGDPLIAVAAESGVGLEVAASCLRKLQQFDPPGVFARDLQECLGIQARALRGDKGLVGALIERHLADLEAKGLHAVASDLGAAEAEIRAATQAFAEMDPKPGLSFDDAPAGALIADAAIVQAGDGWTAQVDDPLASIRLSRRYRQLLRRRRQGHERAVRYLARNLDAATALIAAVQERQRLVLELARSIASRQVRFLERGPAWIRPAALAQVAIALGEDEGRLRLAAFGKLVDTPHGVVPMADFFRLR